MDSAETPGSSSSWERVKELVAAAEEQAPENLDTWLETVCDDAAVREEVARLVRASADAGDFLEGSASEHHLGLRPPHPARLGRYRIIEELGSGGLGVVYAAEDETLHRQVAIKIAGTNEYSSGEIRKRLHWDARAACSLQHPNIVVVYDIGQEGGLDYMVMELVEGETLNKAIPASGMDPGRAIKIALQILDGLGVAHHAGIVHRDLKPTNIIVGDNGIVKLLDFGLAKPPVDLRGTADSPQTIEGRFAGTAAYVSPEQAEGKEVDARGDIFSFGCVFFEMLTGRRAFEGQSQMSVVARILEHEPKNLASLKPEIDPRLAAIVHRCLRKPPAERFQDVAELKRALAECDLPLRTPLPRLIWRYAGWGSWAIAAGAVILACFLTWLWTRRLPGPPPSANYLTRLSADGELTEYPAISPDGRFIAYASDCESHSNLDIFVQDAKSGEATRLTTGPANAYQPVFSPDGGQLVYRSDEAGGGLYIIPTVGGGKKPRLLAAGGRDARFSMDGLWLAFWTGEGGFSLRPGSAQAWYIPANGGAAKLIAPELEVSANPVWDPSGRTLLCVGRRKGETRLAWWVVDFRSHTAQRTKLGGPNGLGMSLREPAGSYWGSPLAWLPDQTVLSAWRQGDATNIWALRVSSDGRQLDAPRRWTAGTAIEKHVSAAIGPDQEPVVVYDALHVTASLRQVELTPSGMPAGSVEPLVEGFSELGPPSLSFDGRKLAFSAAEPERQFIYLTDVGTPHAEQLANVRTLRSIAPLLSGDGQWVTYFAENNGYLISAKGGLAEVVCRRCGMPTDAGRDASEMLFESGAVINQFFACSRHGGQRPVAHVVDAPAMVMSDGRWSKDGRWILFCGAEGHRKAIYAAPVTPSGDVRRSQLVRLSDAGYDAWKPVWSGDGQRVYYIANIDGFNCIWGRAVDPESVLPAAAPFAVAHFHRAWESVSGELPNPYEFHLTAGGRLLVFTVAETKGEVWLRLPHAPPPFRSPL